MSENLRYFSFALRVVGGKPEEGFVHACIFRQLRMEGETKLILVADRDDVAVNRSQYLDIFVSLFDVRGADEDHGDFFELTAGGLAGEAAELTAIGIAAYGYGQRPQVYGRVIGELFCQQDEARAGGEHGETIPDGSLQRLEQAELA